MTKYQVRFKIYHYNNGDGRNGEYIHHKDFKTKVEALFFEKHLLDMLLNKESTRDFAKDFCWDGFLKSIIGIYSISETKIS